MPSSHHFGGSFVGLRSDLFWGNLHYNQRVQSWNVAVLKKKCTKLWKNAQAAEVFSTSFLILCIFFFVLWKNDTIDRTPTPPPRPKPVSGCLNRILMLISSSSFRQYLPRPPIDKFSTVTSHLLLFYFPFHPSLLLFFLFCFSFVSKIEYSCSTLPLPALLWNERLQADESLFSVMAAIYHWILHQREREREMRVGGSRLNWNEETLVFSFFDVFFSPPPPFCLCEALVSSFEPVSVWNEWWLPRLLSDSLCVCVAKENTEQNKTQVQRFAL